MSNVRTARDRVEATPTQWHLLPWLWARQFGALFEVRAPADATPMQGRAVLAFIVVLAAGLRFWGLGDVGLHGDEETMAMPTMHIVEHGTPELPSGMLYPRAVAQLYMMAGSVMVFGESEWAMRVPSAICGVLLVLIAFSIGRRFLTPAWNLAFAAAVALLPTFIVDAQTARMYTFLVTCVAGYVWLLFEWERSGRVIALGGAVALLILGLQFHTLAVFAAFLVFYPGLVRGDFTKLLLGAVAFAVIVGGFVTIDHWIASQYPDASEVAGDDGGIGGARASHAIPQLSLWLMGVAAVVAAAVGTFAARSARGVPAVIAAVLIAGALLAQVAFSYHLAGLLLVAGAVMAHRNGGLTLGRVAPIAIIMAVIAAGQVYLLNENGVQSVRQMLGAMTGRPSVWPYFVISEYSVAAALLVGGAFVAALWRLAHRKPIPDFVLFAVLGVLLPVMLIGLFKWYVPLRYTAAQAIPLLLAAFASAQWLFSRRREEGASGSPHWATIAGAFVVCLLIVNPVALARTVKSGYAMHPDHQGAAAFIRSLTLEPRDVVVAEDVLQQTYYLGQVDYWLLSREVAGMFVRPIDGQLKDFYTNTPLIGNGEELAALLARPDRGAIYVIGSGENQKDGRRHMRGDDIHRMLNSPTFHEVYRGRDGLTTVLRVPPPGR